MSPCPAGAGPSDEAVRTVLENDERDRQRPPAQLASNDNQAADTAGNVLDGLELAIDVGEIIGGVGEAVGGTVGALAEGAGELIGGLFEGLGS